MIRLLILFMAILLSPTMNAQAKAPFISGLRVEGMGYSLFEQKAYDNSAYKVESPETTILGGALTLITGYYVGIGVSKIAYSLTQDTTFKTYNSYFSPTTENIDVTSLEVSLNFGSNFSFMVGAGYLISGAADIIYHNPACSKFSRTAVEVNAWNYFLGVGTPLFGPLKFALLYRVGITEAVYADADIDVFKMRRTFAMLSGGLSFFF